MSGISTHILDLARGKPAANVAVILDVIGENGFWSEVTRGTTDADGRIASILPGGVTKAGEYRLRFATGDYFRSLGQSTIYPEIAVHVRLEAGAKYHLPLLLSPFGYSTYRGS